MKYRLLLWLLFSAILLDYPLQAQGQNVSYDSFTVEDPRNNTVPLKEGPLAVILVDFTELNHTRTRSEIEAFYDQVRQYYLEDSYGKFNLNVTVFGWYHLNKTIDYYGKDCEIPDDVNCDGSPDSWWLLRDAVQAADKDIDFGQFSHMIVVHSGYGEETSKVKTHLWSVAYSGGLLIETKDSRSIRAGAIVPELEAQNSSVVGVYVHEFAHLLGLPDLYGIPRSKQFAGVWDPMDRGLYNGDPKGSQPALHSAWSRIKLGWLPGSNVYILNKSSEAEILLKPLEIETNGTQAVKVVLSNYYYCLVEARAKIGYDAGLPSEGVIISYVDAYAGSGYGIVKIQHANATANILDDAAYQVGATFVDEEKGVTITILSSSSEGYLIKIAYNPPKVQSKFS